jgi:predicted 3-demethylubiquinone-9 3-methyltransferase (glyoxalase superfamily)
MFMAAKTTTFLMFDGRAEEAMRSCVSPFTTARSGTLRATGEGSA